MDAKRGEEKAKRRTDNRKKAGKNLLSVHY